MTTGLEDPGYLLERNSSLMHDWAPSVRLPVCQHGKGVFSVILCRRIARESGRDGASIHAMLSTGRLAYSPRAEVFPRYIFPVVGRIRKSMEGEIELGGEPIIGCH